MCVCGIVAALCVIMASSVTPPASWSLHGDGAPARPRWDSWLTRLRTRPSLNTRQQLMLRMRRIGLGVASATTAAVAAGCYYDDDTRRSLAIGGVGTLCRLFVRGLNNVT